MNVRRLLDGRRLVRPALWRITQAAVAAGVAWQLAVLLPNHARPFFAPIAAVIALGADVGRRGRQAVRLVVGVALGIAIGAGVVAIGGSGAWQIAAATFLAMTCATWLRAQPVTILQAAASAILVVALAQPGENLALQRLLDACIGGAIAIVTAQLFFPVDPLRLLRDAIDDLRGQIASALDEAACALEDHDRERVDRALEQIDRIDDRHVYDVLAVARDVARRAPRRRRARRTVADYGDAVRDVSAAAADARGLATGILRMLRSDPQSDSVAAIRLMASAVRERSPLQALRLLDEAQAERAGADSLGSALVAHALEQIDGHMRRAAMFRLAEEREASEPDRIMSSFVQDVRKEANGFVVALASIAAIGGFLFGYDTGVISGALLLIKGDLHATTFEQSAIVGSLLLGAVFGAILSGYLAGAIGRRRTKIISGCIFAVAAIWSALSPTVWVLIIARFVLGVSVGTASFVSPMYIGELAPKKIRGGLVSFNQLMITSGILIAYIVDFALKDVTNNWRWMLGLGAVPGIALAVGMFFMPESPRWLVEHDREDDAREVLDRAREDENVGEEIEEIREVSRESARVRDLVGRNVRPMLVIGLGLAIFQQIVGINTVIYFAPTIFKLAGVSTSKAIGQTVFIGVTNVVFTIVAVLLLDKFGRRFFLLIGTAGLTIALVGLGLFFQVAAIKEHASWLALASLIFYIASFAIGLGPVFWLMIAEIFPLKIRSAGMSVCTVANWGFNFLVAFTFLQLIDTAGKGGTFFVYAGLGVLAFIFFAWKVPETKGRSLEEIETELGADADEDLTRARERPRERAAS